jgi:hypothetical protein
MKELDKLMKSHGPGSKRKWPAAEVKKLQRWLVIERNAAMQIKKIKNRNP